MAGKNPINWDLIEHLEPTEFKFPGELEPDLVVSLDRFRDFTGLPFIIHEDYATSGHATNSYHYRGEAIDGHFITKEISFSFLVAKILGVMAQTSAIHKIRGIGIYPNWNNPGFHFDIRSDWKIWTQDRSGQYVYF